MKAAQVVCHQCGWLGCRVGEASHPGPVPTLIDSEGVPSSVPSSGGANAVVEVPRADRNPAECDRVATRVEHQNKRLRLSQATTVAVPDSVLNASECDLSQTHGRFAKDTPSSVVHQNRFAELSMDETVCGQFEQVREAGVDGDEVEVCPATTDGAQSVQATDACGLRATPAGTCGLGTDRFFSLATDSDEEQSREPRETVVDHSGSDAESVPPIRNRRRSLRLRWNSATEPSGNCDAISVRDRDV